MTRTSRTAAVAMCALLSTTFAAAEPQRGGGGGAESGQRVAQPRDGGGGPVGPAQPGGPARQPGGDAGRSGYPAAEGPTTEGPYYPNRGSYVFVGGYFYDPFYGPYPWWPASAYGWGYSPVFDYRAEVRILATPREATVYVDGFYAGIVDDFDGTFQRLPLTPGGHRIELFLEGHRTIKKSLYLQPGSTMKLRETLVPLAAGEVSEPPELAPAVPAPPDGTYTEPNGRTQRGLPPPPGPTVAAAGARPTPRGTARWCCTCSRVRPKCRSTVSAGSPSGDGEFEIQLPAGRHRVEVELDGFQRFTAEVDVRDEGPTPVNVSLTRGR